jgi:hypothetical protein
MEMRAYSRNSAAGIASIVLFKCDGIVSFLLMFSAVVVADHVIAGREAGLPTIRASLRLLDSGFSVDRLAHR